METNDSNIKPQTGGLKLLTVFVGVLVLHILVLGGVTAYSWMNSKNSDADLLADKSHKKAASDATAITDGSLPDTTDKTASTSAPTAESGTGSITPPPSASETTSIPAPTGDIVTSGLGSTSVASVPTTPAPVSHGPVITPPETTVKPTPAPTSPLAMNPAMTPEASAPIAPNGTPYVVKSGDSLAKIARLNHTTVAKLKTANSLASDKLHIGQKMVIPARTQVASTATSAPALTSADPSGSTTILGDSPATPAMNVPAAPAVVPAVHKTTVASTAASTPATSGHGRTYTVAKGDTLTKIARKFKTTPTAIMTVNNLSDATKLTIGKRLKIPGQESRSAVNTSPVAPAAVAAPAPSPAPTTTSAPAPASTPSPENEQPAQIEPHTGPAAQLANFMQ